MPSNAILSSILARTIYFDAESDRVSNLDVVFVILASIIKFVLLYGINCFYTVQFPC